MSDCQTQISNKSKHTKMSMLTSKPYHACAFWNIELKLKACNWQQSKVTKTMVKRSKIKKKNNNNKPRLLLSNCVTIEILSDKY